MTGIILDGRASACDQEQYAEFGCDGVAINCHADAFADELNVCLGLGMDVFAVVSQGDDEVVQRLYAEKGAAVCFACEGGLTETARLRELAPDAQWVPITDVYKVDASYTFTANAYQEGFKTFQLNPGSFEERRVNDGGLSLTDWVDRAKHLGFERVWLDSSEAQAVGKGFDLIAARRTSRDLDGGVWMSGGGTTLDHVRNLTNECPVNSIVVDKAFLEEVGMGELRGVLAASTSTFGDGAETLPPEQDPDHAPPTSATG